MTRDKDASHENRREFIRRSTLLAAGATAMGFSPPAVHAAEDNTVRLALIGCGNRGAGAVANALNTSYQGPIKLYAMADLSLSQIESKLTALKNQYPENVDVAPERKFLGFEAYKDAIDLLKPGDIAMCTTRA